MTPKLRLGPLPKTATVKLTISLPVELKALLDEYAQMHARTYGDGADGPTLIPHILQSFFCRDRAFQRARRIASSSVQPALPHSATGVRQE